MNNLYDKTVNPHVFDYLHEKSYAYNFYCPSEVVLHFIMFFIQILKDSNQLITSRPDKFMHV